MVQSKEPSFHSWRRPKIKIRRKAVRPSAEGIGVGGGRRGRGSKRTISMSKTRKITARRKKRRENGIRAEFLGSNPHSKGESFSRSWSDRAAKAHAARGIRRASVAAIKNERRVGSMRSLWEAGRPVVRVKI